MHPKAIIYSLDRSISPWKLKTLENFDLDLDRKQAFLDYCTKNSIKSLVWDDIFLKKTKNKPYVLYYVWNYEILRTHKIIWIVWPRKIDSFIENKLKVFFEYASKYKNIAIVSGFADWTDLFAHNLALQFNIPTIAVLGFWFTKAFNISWRSNISKISKNWLILSEFKLKQPWTHRSFPQRNRIISWLSDMLFVVSCAEKSWTLITINSAIDLKTPVFSCFRDMDDIIWKGTNRLISESKIQGIYDMDLFFQNFSDILNLEKNEKGDTTLLTNLSEDQELVLKSIQSWKSSLEEVCIETEIWTSEVMVILSDLELNWIIFNNWDSYSVS